MGRRRHRFRIVVAVWGRGDEAEIENSCLLASSSQTEFEFEFRPGTLPLRPQSYRLRNGAVDLDRAMGRFIRSRNFRKRFPGRTAFVTSHPYASGAALKDAARCLRLRDLYHIDDKLAYAQNLAIVSTYKWQALPNRKALPSLKPTGARVLRPYLTHCFALIALSTFVDFGYHTQVRGCPFDYSDGDGAIDRFFEVGKICSECATVLRMAELNRQLSKGQLNAISRLLDAARGIPLSDGYLSCFISYGQPDATFASRIHMDLVAAGVECWLYECDSVPGRRTWAEIGAQRRSADRVLVVCSRASLVRDGVLKEIESQVDEDPDRIVPLSLDNKWYRRRFQIKRGSRDLGQYIRDRNFANFSKRSYKREFDKLLEGLRVSRPDARGAAT